MEPITVRGISIRLKDISLPIEIPAITLKDRSHYFTGETNTRDFANYLRVASNFFLKLSQGNTGLSEEGQRYFQHCHMGWYHYIKSRQQIRGWAQFNLNCRLPSEYFTKIIGELLYGIKENERSIFQVLRRVNPEAKSTDEVAITNCHFIRGCLLHHLAAAITPE